MCRITRPISDEERPALAALGARIGELRRKAGLSRAELAVGAELSRSAVGRIERGERRTRRSTLERIAATLVAHIATRRRPDRLAAELVKLAGDALAAESDYADRVARRRARRARRTENLACQQDRMREQKWSEDQRQIERAIMLGLTAAWQGDHAVSKGVLTWLRREHAESLTVIDQPLSELPSLEELQAELASVDEALGLPPGAHASASSGSQRPERAPDPPGALPPGDERT